MANKCMRCEDPEHRIDGYCSIHCRDLAIADTRIAQLTQRVMDNAEDWALAGIPPNSELAGKLAEHYYQRKNEREELAAAKVRIAELEAVIARHDLCHDLHGKVGRAEFEEGCRRETVKEYGSCGWAERLAKLEDENKRLKGDLEAALQVLVDSNIPFDCMLPRPVAQAEVIAAQAAQITLLNNQLNSAAARIHGQAEALAANAEKADTAKIKVDEDRNNVMNAAILLRKMAWRVMDTVKVHGLRDDYALLRTIVDDPELTAYIDAQKASI